jgi:UV DNA damage endonuclease
VHAIHPYRLGFAVKVLGGPDGKPMRTSDARRWQSGPHLRHSIELLDATFDLLDKRALRMFRMSSSTVPYGTHPDLPQFDYRRQIDECGEELARLGAKARDYGIRLSTHPGQYTVLNSPDPDIARKAAADLEQDALLLDALGAGPEAAVVVHVGGVYGERRAALHRFAGAHEKLSERARARVAVEHDERAFDLAEVIDLARATGARAIYDMHHHRCNRAPSLYEHADAMAAAFATWPEGQRPKVHLSSPRTELRSVRAKPAAPLLDQHADFVTPWDLEELLRAAPAPVDVMIEAKAKDLAVEWLRVQIQRVAPVLAAAEKR